MPAGLATANNKSGVDMFPQHVANPPSDLTEQS